MNWLFIGGVLLLYGIWIGIAGVSEIVLIPPPWNDAVFLAWAGLVPLLQIAPWVRFARRTNHLGAVAANAFVASLLVGGMAVTLGMMWDGPFPDPHVSCGIMCEPADFGLESTPGVATFLAGVVTYAVASATLASVAGAITLELCGAASDRVDGLLRLGRRRRDEVR